MSIILSKFFLFFSLILSGALSRKHLFSEGFQKELTRFVLYYTYPCSILVSFQSEIPSGTLHGVVKMLFISAVFHVGCIVVSRFVFPRQGEERRAVLRFGMISSNSGFIGIPFAESFFGAQGVLLASIFLIPQRIVTWTVGVSYFSREKKESVRTLFRNPCICATLLGCTMMAAGIKLPFFLESILESFSRCNSGLSMFVVGMTMSNLKIKDFLDQSVISYSLLRLLFIPAILLGGCRLLVRDVLVSDLAVLLGAMPCASLAALLSSQFDRGAGFAASCVAVSTSFSLVSIPFWFWLLQI